MTKADLQEPLTLAGMWKQFHQEHRAARKHIQTLGVIMQLDDLVLNAVWASRARDSGWLWQYRSSQQRTATFCVGDLVRTKQPVFIQSPMRVRGAVWMPRYTLILVQSVGALWPAPMQLR